MDADTRRKYQLKLKNTKNTINNYIKNRDMKIEFSSGDSLQGFTKDPVLAFTVCILIEYIMHPIKIHAGIGNGEIYVMDNTEGSNANDGPAYHSAASSLEISKKTSRELVVSFESSMDDFLNQILALIERIKIRNTEKQNFYLSLFCYLQLFDFNYEIINKIIGDHEVHNLDSLNANVQNHASYISKAFETTLQNTYDMLKKSDAQIVCESYFICINYLKNLSIRRE